MMKIFLMSSAPKSTGQEYLLKRLYLSTQYWRQKITMSTGVAVGAIKP